MNRLLVPLSIALTAACGNGAEQSPAADGGAGGGVDAGGSPDVGGNADGGAGLIPMPTDFDLDALEAGKHESAVRYLAEAGVATMPIAADAAPAVGQSYDSAFNTRLTRVTAAPFGNHVYSQLQAFSTDNAFVLLLEGDSEETVGYTVRSFPALAPVALDTSSWNVPKWHPTEFHTLVHFDSNEDAVLRLQLTDVDSAATETAFTFPAPYERIAGNQTFDEISRTGRWFAGMAQSSAGPIIFSFDLQNMAIGAELPLAELYDGSCTPDPEWGEVEPDWIGVSPLGNYLVVQWAGSAEGRCNGLETFAIATGAYAGRVTREHPHGDMQVLADGTTEVFVTGELSGPGAGASYLGGEPGGSPLDANYPALSYRALPGTPGGEAAPSYLYLTDWLVDHVSCRGPFGWCLITARGNPDNGAFDPLEGELFLFRLDGSGVVRLAHHRSSSADYWQQPHGSLSSDGRYVIFDSDWASAAPERAAYVIDLAIR